MQKFRNLSVFVVLLLFIVSLAIYLFDAGTFFKKWSSPKTIVRLPIAVLCSEKPPCVVYTGELEDWGSPRFDLKPGYSLTVKVLDPDAIAMVLIDDRSDKMYTIDFMGKIVMDEETEAYLQKRQTKYVSVRPMPGSTGKRYSIIALAAQ
jgi:hypothetical protein